MADKNDKNVYIRLYCPQEAKAEVHDLNATLDEFRRLGEHDVYYPLNECSITLCAPISNEVIYCKTSHPPVKEHGSKEFTPQLPLQPTVLAHIYVSKAVENQDCVTKEIERVLTQNFTGDRVGIEFIKIYQPKPWFPDNGPSGPERVVVVEETISPEGEKVVEEIILPEGERVVEEIIPPGGGRVVEEIIPPGREEVVEEVIPQ